ncbi:MAG: hypothetical protein WB239_03100, partial [Acidimicrobiia bacterium]
MLGLGVSLSRQGSGLDDNREVEWSSRLRLQGELSSLKVFGEEPLESPADEARSRRSRMKRKLIGLLVVVMVGALA